ncbi:hypothetical protein [Paracraurococcus lichenis]|uniref:Uncharacterized protein n=1 Tax=Paracraurococcus lichenis TaxID=3064888 RepID=A0ABT9ECK5_9PROT|nr:hypothetical protein [Paracraurococcus sp. LOR1-02]MDO9713765.1 hypothetical protein [Paracraurococcus sp. LOR1-02]
MTGDLEDAPRRRRKRRLTDLELAEISVVDLPANTGARQVLFKNLAAPEVAMPLDPDALRRMAEAAVAKVAAQIQAHADAAGRAAARLQAGGDAVHKTAAGTGAADLAEALELARAGAAARARQREGSSPPASYWQAALAALGERLLPGAPPSSQMNEALRSPEGRLLVAAMQGDDRVLTPGG